MWRSFTTATAFLTILPLPAAETFAPADLARSLATFPLVGFLLGLACATVAVLLTSLVPAPLLAVTLTALLAILTRGLHLDGLADLADGIGGGYTPQRRLEIMKDSRTGAFGAIALALLLLFKAAAFLALIQAKAWAPLLLAPAFSRYAIAATAFRSPYARPEGGLGKPFLEHLGTRDIATATVIVLLIALPIAWRLAPALLAATLLIVTFMRWLTGRTLGGITGDVLGATSELTEALLLGLAATLTAH